MSPRAVQDVAAYFAGVQIGTLRKWVRRGNIAPPDSQGCYDLLDIADWIDNRRDQHRAKIAETRYGICVSRRHGDVKC